MSIYILQKDTPNGKAGEKFYPAKDDRGAGYCNDKGMFWHCFIVENNPEWFRPEEEKIRNISHEVYNQKEKAIKELLSGLDVSMAKEILGRIKGELDFNSVVK